MSQRSNSIFRRKPDLPRGYIAGLNLSISGGNPAVSVGECRMGTSANRSLINGTLLSSTTKAINATWAAGNANGGMANGVVLAANTWYHVFLLAGGRDVGYDTSVEAANLVLDAAVIAAGFSTSYRRLGSFRTDGASVPTAFTQLGDLFMWDNPTAADHFLNGAASTDLPMTLTFVPPGIRTLAHIEVTCANATTDSLVISHGGASIAADGTLTASPLDWIDAVGANRSISAVVMTDTSRNLRYRVTDATSDVYVEVKGYTDYRGRSD